MSTTKRHEAHRRAGRRPGSSGTRDEILAAAAQHFAEHGYDRASLRAIAAAAGVDHKLIAHFFGSKQQLFIAAVGLPLNPAEILPAILDGDRDTIGERIAALLLTILEQPQLHQRLTGVIRGAAGEPQLARMMREFLGRELFARAANLLGADDGALRANLAGSQLVGLIMARYVIKIEPLASTPPQHVAAVIAPTLQRYLVGPLDPESQHQSAQHPRIIHRPERPPRNRTDPTRTARPTTERPESQ